MVKIRAFTLDDYDEVIQVWTDAGLTLSPSDTRPELAKKLERDPDLFLVAEEEQRIVGAVIGAWDGRRGWIYHLAVRPQMQGHRIGQQLMAEVEQGLRQRGALKVNLLVQRHNAKVVDFYQRLGYKTDDVLFMGKFLG